MKTSTKERLKKILILRLTVRFLRNMRIWLILSNPFISAIRVRCAKDKISRLIYNGKSEFKQDTIYRETYCSDNNRRLVELAKKKDYEGINEWFESNHTEYKDYDSYFKNRISTRAVFQYICSNEERKDILDVACGYGEIDIALTKKGYNVHGCDLRKKRVAALRKQLSSIEQCDIMDYPQDRQFDIVIALEMLEHVVDIEAVLDKIHSLLYGGGVLYLSVPNGNMIEHENHIRLFTIDSLVYLLRKHGFKENRILTLPYINRDEFGANNDIVGIFEKTENQIYDD